MTTLKQDYTSSKLPVCQNIQTFHDEQNVTLIRASKKGMKNLRKLLSCSVTAYLMLLSLLIRPIAAMPTNEALQYSNYGSEEAPAPHIMLLPTIQERADWYSPADYPLEEVISSADDFKRVMTKRGEDQSQMALNQIFSRLRSRNTKDQNSKRGIDFGLGRGFSGSQAAKHFMGIAAAQYSGGPGKRKRSGGMRAPIYAVDERW